MKVRNKIDEKNRKKAEERMRVVSDHYEEICVENNVVSKMKNTGDVLRKFYPKAPLRDFEDRML